MRDQSRRLCLVCTRAVRQLLQLAYCGVDIQLTAAARKSVCELRCN